MILRKIGFWIVEAVYPLIPSLYDIFQILAKNEFLTVENIQNFSNNVYIFISVCMLFAFGIRLLNGIVNPDLLDDKKKGVKNVFFNAFAAVLLMVIIPLGFRMLYSFQARIIDNHLIEKVFLGTELKSDQNPGQILTAYAFSSFCYPNKEVTSGGLDSKGEDLYNEALKDASKIKKLSGYINDGKGFGKNREYDLEFNPILAPVTGIVVLYELVVMCMDLALRTIKLGLLQLVAPIILCGFIFKGTELLQKWFKEVITTWVLLFLKVAMVVFMIYGLSLLTDYFDNLNLPDGVKLTENTKRIIKVFILIGLLQVIKQLPNLINSIFGTNIQPRGGIKGRLGEMAAVGGLAQKGWDAIGNKAKSVGLAAAKVAPVAGALASGLASGPLGWAALGAAAGAGYGLYRGKRWWEKGDGNFGPGKDTKFGRFARTAGAYGKGIGKGLGTKGGLFKSISEGTKAYDETDIAKSRKAAKENEYRRGAFRNFKIADNGELEPINKIQENLINGKITNDQAVGQRKKAATQEWNNIDDKMNNTYKQAKNIGVSDKVKDKQKKYKDSIIRKAHGDIVQKKYDAVNDQVDSMIKKAASLGNSKLEGELTDLRSNYFKGDYSMEKYIDLIGQLKGVNKGDMGKLNADMQSFTKELNAKFSMHDSDGNEMITSIYDWIPKQKGGGFVITDVSGEIGKMTKDAESKKSAIDKQMAELNYSDEQKNLVNTVTDSITTTAETVAAVDSKFDIHNQAQVAAHNAYNRQSGEADLTYVPNPTPTPAPAPAPQPQAQPQYNDNTIPASGETTQETINRVNNVHDITTEEHNTRYQDLADAFSNPIFADQGAPAGAPQHQQGDSSNPDHQRDGSYTAGIYSGGTVNANVDLGGLETKLDQINQSVNNSGQNITQAVNTQGANISGQLTQTNERLKHIHSGITHMDTQLSGTSSGIKDMKDSSDNVASSIGDLADSINSKNNDDSE